MCNASACGKSWQLYSTKVVHDMGTLNTVAGSSQGTEQLTET